MLKVVAPKFTAFAFNRMTISDYNTKPVCGDRAIILKLYGFTWNFTGSTFKLYW